MKVQSSLDRPSPSDHILGLTESVSKVREGPFPGFKMTGLISV